MLGFSRVGSVGDFREGRGRVVVVDGVKVAVFRIGTAWYAIRDACPHMGASLGDGKVAAGKVTCHMHGWTFDLTTGACSQTRQTQAKIYDVRIEHGAVFVKPPPEPSGAPTGDDDWVVFDPDKHLREK